MDELVRLSIILGRVLKAIYRSIWIISLWSHYWLIFSPSGLAFTTDESFNQLLGDIENWQRSLPENLKYHGSESPRPAGLYQILDYCTYTNRFQVYCIFCMPVCAWCFGESLCKSVTYVLRTSNLVWLLSSGPNWWDWLMKPFTSWMPMRKCMIYGY